MNLPGIPLFVLDTETTGFVPRTHRVIEYAAARIIDGKIEKEFETLISHDGDIPPPVQVLTAIKTEDLAGKPKFEEVLPEMKKMLDDGMIIVGQNINYDIGMLKGEGWDLSGFPLIDTSMLASLVFPELRSYSLGYLSNVLGLIHEPRHRALGDVRATVELLARCWERLLELPDGLIGNIHGFAQKSPDGYRRLIDALAQAHSPKKSKPEWLKSGSLKLRHHDLGAFEIGDTGNIVPPEVELIEENLHPGFLEGILDSLKHEKAGAWVGVKNLEATLRRIELPAHAAALYPPDLVLSKSSAAKFLAQEAFTSDEFTLAAKLKMYAPVIKADFPVHGGEYEAWNGKLKCTDEDAEYAALKRTDKPVKLIDHQELLRCIAADDSEIPPGSRVVIDDASMLEDTATAAFGWACCTASLRAAAQGGEMLTRCADLIELWMEKVRAGEDDHYLTANDLAGREAKGLIEQVEHLLAEENIPVPARKLLQQIRLMLDPNNLSGRIAWIEVYIDGSRHIKSVPLDIASLLSEKLYKRYRTSLIVPPGSAGNMAAILPRGTKTQVKAPGESSRDIAIDIEFPEESDYDPLFANPSGKTVLLAGSKRIIEGIFVKNFSALEQRGITLICQSFAGGQSRMQAEFAAAKSPAILVATPWTYETFELPPETVDQLVIHTLPFDHPHHPVLKKRSERFADAFNEYTLKRARYRLFRLLRTFSRHRTRSGKAAMLDGRLRMKTYGKGLVKYMASLSSTVSSEPENPLVSDKEKQMRLL